MKKIIYIIILILFSSCSNSSSSIEKMAEHKEVEVKIGFIGANLSTIDEKVEDVRYEDRIYKIKSGGIWRMVDLKEEEKLDILFYTGEVESRSVYNSLYRGEFFSKLLEEFNFDFLVPEENLWINEKREDKVYLDKSILLSNIVPKNPSGTKWNRSYIKTINEEKVGFISIKKEDVLSKDFLSIDVEETINEKVKDLKSENINKIILITDIEEIKLKKLIEKTRGISFIFKEGETNKQISSTNYKNKDRKKIKFYEMSKNYNFYGNITLKFNSNGDVIDVEDNSKLIYGKEIKGFDSSGVFGKTNNFLFLGQILESELDIKKISENKVLQEKYQKEIDGAVYYSEKKIGYNNQTMSKKELLEGLNNTIYKEYGENIDIIIQNLGVLNEGLRYGEIKVKDLYEIQKKDESYFIIVLTGKKIEEIIDSWNNKQGDKLIIKNSKFPIVGENKLIYEKEYRVLLNSELYETSLKIEKKKKDKISRDILYFLKKYIEENKKSIDSSN
ncbi:MAG: hypothetical protein KAH04_01325 [Psychrilyobacter sp.]|nr:hypothetical protein [Psychrilyobacter sp.]